MTTRELEQQHQATQDESHRLLRLYMYDQATRDEVLAALNLWREAAYALQCAKADETFAEIVAQMDAHYESAQKIKADPLSQFVRGKG